SHERHGHGRRGIVRRGPLPDREVPQGRREGQRAGLDNHQDRRPQGSARAAGGEGQAGRAGPWPDAEDVAGGRHRRSITAATEAVIAPNTNVAEGAMKNPYPTRITGRRPTWSERIPAGNACTA